MQEDPAALSAESELESFPLWDSLAIVEFAVFVNIEFALELKTAQLSQARTVRDLYNLIGSDK